MTYICHLRVQNKHRYSESTLQLRSWYRNYISYFLHYPLFHAKWSSLLNNIKENDRIILEKSEAFGTYILPYGKVLFKDKVNFLILNASLDFFFFFFVMPYEDLSMECLKITVSSIICQSYPSGSKDFENFMLRVLDNCQWFLKIDTVKPDHLFSILSLNQINNLLWIKVRHKYHFLL